MKKYSIIILFVIIGARAIAQSDCDYTTPGGQDYDCYMIWTPQNTLIYASELKSGEMSQTQKNDARWYWLDYYNNDGDGRDIYYLDEATYTYNCHAFAWFGGPVWLNTPKDDTYWNDESYFQIAEQSKASKVSFGNCPVFVCDLYDYYGNCISGHTEDDCDHSARTTAVNNYFYSKWGPSPLFEHYKDDCPYSQSSGLRYYKLCDGRLENLIISIDLDLQDNCHIYYIEDVTINNNTDVNLKINGNLQINGAFGVELGSTLNIHP